MFSIAAVLTVRRSHMSCRKFKTNYFIAVVCQKVDSNFIVFFFNFIISGKRIIRNEK